MEKLIELLHAIENSVEIVSKHYLTDDPHPLVEEASGKASEELITNEGRCNWTNINALKKSGYDVFAGEQDSFGWLTGCISTTKGVVVYG